MLQFSRRDDLQNTGIDPVIEYRRIVWTFINFLKLQEERRKEAFHTIIDFHIVTRFKS